MRLSEESQTNKCFVQLSQRDCDSTQIRFELNKRPSLVSEMESDIYWRESAADIREQFCKSLAPSFRSLLASNCLRMRVNFGQLQLLVKKKTAENELSWNKYGDALNECARRGRGVALETGFVTARPH